MTGEIVHIDTRFGRDLRHLALAGELVRAACRSLGDGLDEQTAYEIELAVSEALTNAIKYCGTEEEQVQPGAEAPAAPTGAGSGESGPESGAEAAGKPESDETAEPLMDAEVAVPEETGSAATPATGTPPQVRLEFIVYDDRIEVRVSDPGEPFDMEEVSAPDFDAVAPGGYGLYIIRNVMSRVRQERRDGWNILIMEKDLPKSG